MSGTGSLMIRNLRRPADYQKAVMTQDQLLKIAAANDANIASARKSYSQGEIPPLTPQQNATAVELQQDTGKNESDAINNLIAMGFRYDAAAEIVAQLSHDERVVLNNSFPEIKADFSKKFVVSRITPTAFVEYLRKFIDLFQQTKGLSNTTALFNDKFDALVNNIEDLRAIIPTRTMVLDIKRMIGRLPVGAEVQAMLDGLARTLPDEEFFRALDQENAYERAKDLTALQNILANLPTRDEFGMVMEDLRQGRLTQQEAIKEIQELVEGINASTIESLFLLEQQTKTQKRQYNVISSVKIYSTEIPGLALVRDRTATGASTGAEKVVLLDSEAEPTNHTFTNKEFQYALTHDAVFRDWFMSSYRFPSIKPTFSDLKEYIRAGGPAQGSSAFSDESEGRTTKESGESGTRGKGLKTKKIGKGVIVEEAPTYRQFGKYVIHQNQLLNNDMLNVKYPSLGRIPQFKPTTISEPTKDFIIELLDTGKANPRVYDTLPKEERKLFEKIATGAGIFHHLKLKKTITDDEAKDYERFQVLKGEYLAGNNSQALMKELRRLIVKFMNDGRIHKSEGTNLLMELSI